MGLSLLAEDTDDLAVISAALQDAILRLGDIRFDPVGRSVTMRLTRYRHEIESPSRIEAGLRIDSVMRMESAGVSRENPDAFAVLLDAQFEETDAPAGQLLLNLSGGGAIRLSVECLDLLLKDIGKPRNTDSVPDHETV